MDIKEININGETNFVAEVSSVFHLLCAVSYAYNVSKQRKINGIIFVREHYIMNNPIDIKKIEFDNLKIELIRFSSSYDMLKFTKEIDISGKIKTVNKDEFLYLLSIKVPNYELFKKIKNKTDKKILVVLIDEGTGTYYNFSNALYPLKSFIKKSLIKLNSSKTISYFFLFRKNGELVPDNQVVENLVDFISNKSGSLFEIQNKEKYLNSSSRYVIFITGLFVELGFISLNDYKKKLLTLKNILEENNLKLLIKPYQSEDYSKYDDLNIDLLPWDAPCESLFPVIKPVLTLGFLSTSMVTGKVFYDIPSIDVSNVFNLKGNISYHRKYEKIFRIFRNYIKRVDSFAELSIILKNKIQNNTDNIS